MNAFDEFMDQYKIYGNGTELVPIFRVKQWLEHEAKQRIEIPTVPISVTQYADSIIALQKLEDIRRVVWQNMTSGNALELVKAVRAITDIRKGEPE